MNTNHTDTTLSSANYRIIIPISMCCALISIFVSIGILILIYLTKRLHTISHILISNTCLSSIFYSLVQIINYMYLLLITWDTNDLSCRFRAYFGYMSIAGVIYSYFIQALSRYFFSIFHTNHRWILSFKIHSIMIGLQWLIVMIISLPSLVTKDIYYRPTFLCWVPKEKFLHSVYTLIAYYIIPIILIIGIYLKIYMLVKTYEKTSLEAIKKVKQHRNLEILRNILILIGIYTCGGIPTLLYITTKIEIFYSIGIVSLSLFVTIEKVLTIFLDREIRNTVKLCFVQTKTAVTPININRHQHIIQPKITTLEVHQTRHIQ